MNNDVAIAKALKDKFEYMQKYGYEIFGLFVYGSQNYQLDYIDSDIDTKCIVIPTLEDIVCTRDMVNTVFIPEDKSHIEVKDIRLLWRYFKKQKIDFIEILV